MKNSPFKKSTWIAVTLFALLIVGLDQLTKCLTVQHIAPFADVPVIENILHLTFVKNEGAAFSMLSGMRWFFVVIVCVYLAAVWFLIRKKFISKPFELWCIAAVTGGAIGNLIDRIATGQVVDMIVFKFLYVPLPSMVDGHLKLAMTPFAVFNIADCFITCGVAALAVYIIFFSKEEKTIKEPPAPTAEESEDDTAQ